MVQQGSSEDIRFYLLPQPPENMKKNMQIRKKVTVEVNFCIVLLTCIARGRNLGVGDEDGCAWRCVRGGGSVFGRGSSGDVEQARALASLSRAVSSPTFNPTPPPTDAMHCIAMQ